MRDVAVRLRERAAHELALEAAHRDLHVLLQAAFAGERGRRGPRPAGGTGIGTAGAAAHLGREVLDAELLRVAEEHRALDDVLELADVAGPRVVAEHIERLRLDAADVLLQALVELREEVLDEERDVASRARAARAGGSARR